MSDDVDYGARALTLRNQDLPRVWSINQSIQYPLLPRPWSLGSSPANNIHPENRIWSFWRFVAWNCSNNRKRIWSGAFHHPVGSSSRSNSLVDIIDTCWHIWGCLQECFFMTQNAWTHIQVAWKSVQTPQNAWTQYGLSRTARICQMWLRFCSQAHSFTGLLHGRVAAIARAYAESCAALLEFF